MPKDHPRMLCLGYLLGDKGGMANRCKVIFQRVCPESPVDGPLQFSQSFKIREWVLIMTLRAPPPPVNLIIWGVEGLEGRSPTVW